MILKYYIDEIKHALKLDESDISYDERILIRWLNSQRALFTKNEINKGNILINSVYQSINELELIMVSGSMTPNFTSNDRYLTTLNKLPDVMEIKGVPKFSSIRIPELGGEELNYLVPEKIKYAGNGKFNTGEIYVTYYKDRLYIKVPKTNKDILNMKYISVDCIFINPLELESVIDSNGIPAYNRDIDTYPINDTLWEYMLGAIRNNRYALIEQIRDRESNDDSDNS